MIKWLLSGRFNALDILWAAIVYQVLSCDVKFWHKIAIVLAIAIAAALVEQVLTAFVKKS